MNHNRRQHSHRQWAAMVWVIGLVGAYFLGWNLMTRSSLFQFQSLEWQGVDQQSWVGLDELQEKVLPLVAGKSLFEIDLHQIQRNLRDFPWIDQLSARKKFPRAIEISLSFSKPIAILEPNGSTRTESQYVDSQLRIFGEVKSIHRADLPVLHRIGPENNARFQEAVAFIQTWNQVDQSSADLQSKYPIQSVEWSPQRGYRIVFAHPEGRLKGKLLAEVGPSLSQSDQSQTLFKALSRISRERIPAKSILSLLNKKVVVRTD